MAPTCATARSRALTGASLVGVMLEGFNQHGSHTATAFGLAPDLRQANLRAANLAGFDLSDADLRGADLTRAVLRGAVFTNAHLEGALLNGADLTGAVLVRARLAGAHLLATVLRDADLSEADLRDCDVTVADRTGIRRMPDRPVAATAPRAVERDRNRDSYSPPETFLIESPMAFFRPSPTAGAHPFAATATAAIRSVTITTTPTYSTVPWPR